MLQQLARFWDGRALHSIAVPATAFLFAVFYNGPHSDLPWLAVAFLLAVIWLSIGLYNFFNAPVTNQLGWLPLTAGLYLAWLVIAPRFSVFPQGSFLDGLMLAVTPVVFFAWLLAGNNGNDLRWRGLWRALALVALLLGTWGAIEFFAFGERAHGALIDANVYAALLNLFLIPLCYRYVAYRRPAEPLPQDKWLLGLIATFAAFQFMAQSRGATLALAVVLVIGFWACPKSPDVWRRALRMLVVLIACYVAVQLADRSESRLAKLVAAPTDAMEKDLAVTGRLALWSSTWKMFREGNLLTGSGLGTFKLSYARYRTLGDRTSGGNLAHNDYLQALQEGGLIFFAFLVTMTFVAPLMLLFQVRRRSREAPNDERAVEATALTLALVAISLHAMVNFVHYMLAIAFVTGLYLARSWQILAPGKSLPVPQTLAIRLNRKVVRTILYVLLALPTLALLTDAAIFLTFRGPKPLMTVLSPPQRNKAIAISIALRPSNLLPREEFLRILIERLERMRSADEKQAMINLINDEIDEAQRRSPGLALWPFLKAKVHVLSDNPDRMLRARTAAEQALDLAPNAFEFRLTLIQILVKLGETEQAMRVAGGGKRWIEYTDDFDGIYELARESERLALSLHREEEQKYWGIIAERASTLLASRH